MFGTLSFGEIAVDGFFLISGYLITQSFLREPSFSAYLTKRFARIVPGYLICFLFCVVVVAPLAGGGSVLTGPNLSRLAARVIKLAAPAVAGAFDGLPYPSLNGAMWTIGYEFRCYLMVPVLGWLGCYSPRGKQVLAAAAIVLLALDAATSEHGPLVGSALLRYLPHRDVHLTSVFVVGMTAFLHRDRLVLRRSWAIGAMCLLVVSLCRWYSADAGYAIFGGYAILWFSLKAPVVRLSRLDNSADISYGLYLYGWPVQMLFIWWYRSIDPWLLSGVSLTIAATFGLVSWFGIEKPCLRLARDWIRTKNPGAASTAVR